TRRGSCGGTRSTPTCRSPATQCPATVAATSGLYERREERRSPDGKSIHVGPARQPAVSWRSHRYQSRRRVSAPRVALDRRRYRTGLMRVDHSRHRAVETFEVVATARQGPRVVESTNAIDVLTKINDNWICGVLISVNTRKE